MTARPVALPASPSWTPEPITQTRERRGDSGVWALDELLAQGESTRRPPPSGERRVIGGPRVERRRAVEDRVFETYGPLVRRIAARTIRRLPRSLTMDDVVSAGWLGMAEALGRRTPHMSEEQFEACASYRVRGAILDYLRLLDPLSRRLRSFARRSQTASRALAQRLGREPTQEELAAHLEITVEQLEHLLVEVREATAERGDALIVDAPSSQPSPESSAIERESWERLRAGVAALPERLKLVLTLHHEQEWSLRAIGEALGVTESRACQLHGEAVRRVRAHLEGRALSRLRRDRKVG